MAEVKITDLVPQDTIDKVKELDAELRTLLDTYVNVAKELAKGVKMKVEGLDDLDKLETVLVEKGKEATEVTNRMRAAIEEQNRTIGNTTNTIARELMERERRNKLVREEYRDGEKVKSMISDTINSYENQTKELAKLDIQLKANKKSQQDLEKTYKSGGVSYDEYIEQQAELIARNRELSLSKSQLSQLMKVEEKINSDNAGSYNQLSHQLELLKKTYKDMTDVQRDSDVGKEFERAIQDLDAHLKDMAADMGEFQRNVGNYAIAGRDGIVSTESLMVALQQEAKTFQDVIDQTKILEEAKNMLDKSDAGYEQTLSSLNAALEENYRKINDVSDIIDKEATTVAEAESQNKRLQQALKYVDLSADDAQEQIDKLNDKIQKNEEVMERSMSTTEKKAKAEKEAAEAAKNSAEAAKKLQQEEERLSKEREKANEEIERQQKQNEELADSMLNLIGINANFGSSLDELSNSGSQDFLSGLNTKAKALWSTLMGLITNPWILTFLGIAGVGAGLKWWYDYNKGLVEATKLTKDFTGLTGDELKGVRNEIQAVSDMFGKDFRDTLESANALSKQFGISMDDALKLIEDGFIAGADVNGEFLDNIKEYPAYFKEAGISASEFIAITTQANQAGIYSDKGIDVIKEGNIRIREMTKSTASALDAIGISSKQAVKDLTDGSKSTFDIMKEVSAKLAEFPETAPEVGAALADIFGGPGEDAGLQYIKMLKDMDTDLDKVKDRTGELGKLQEEQLRSEVELQNVIASVFDITGGSFESMTTKAKIFVNKGITAIVKGCADIVNWFVKVYNEAVHVRICVASLVSVFKSLWTVAKGLFELLINGFKGLGGTLEGIMLIFSGDIEAGIGKIKESFVNGFKNIKDTVLKTGKEIGDNFAKEFGEAADKRLKGINLDSPKVNKTGGDDNDNDKTGGGNINYSPKQSDEDKKGAEKAAKEELKRLQELETSKIAMMSDGHEKELATIRLNYRKKLDEIKGNGETEKALRLQLAEQCDKEIADCELRYQKELAKINLANRLASVKEGSKEELDLKLAQIEATKQEEIRAAEKNGADLLLIEEKFEIQKQKLREEYAEKRVSKIEKEFAEENEIRETALINAVAKLKMQQRAELMACGENGAKREKIEKDYAYRIAKVQHDAAIQTAQETISMLQKVVDAENLSTEEREAAIRKLAKAQADLNALMAEGPELAKKKNGMQEWLDSNLSYINAFAQATADMLNGVNDLMQTVFDGQLEKIEALQEANEAEGEAEISRITELVEKKVITEEEGEARKRASEAKTAQKNEELQRKAQQIKIKQAKWDKANSIAQATISTSLAILNALKTQPFWLGIAMAAIAGAMGAVQIATIAATPIPQYAKGTDYHKGGPAIVGDGGRQELVLFKGGGAWITPDVPTLVDIPEGSSVLPSVEALLNNPVSPVMEMPITPDIIPDNRPVYNDENIRRLLSELGMLMRMQIKIQKSIAYKNEYEAYKNSKM